MKKIYIVLNTITTATKKFNNKDKAMEYISNNQSKVLCLIEVEIDNSHNLSDLSGCMY